MSCAHLKTIDFEKAILSFENRRENSVYLNVKTCKACENFTVCLSVL